MSALLRRERRGPMPAELLYGRLLATAVQHAAGDGPAAAGAIRLAGGPLRTMPLERWLGSVDAADAAILRRAAAPVLDLGCGPGRHLAALQGRGLGIDLSPVAVRIARARGVDAVLGSLFGAIPGAGSWQTALLLDGNIGIGGAPRALLRRARELLAPGGAVLVELEPPGTRTARARVRLEAHGIVSDWFAWAFVGVDAIAALAADAGFAAGEPLEAEGRWFASLRRR